MHTVIYTLHVSFSQPHYQWEVRTYLFILHVHVPAYVYTAYC